MLRARDSVGAQDAAVVMRAVRRSLLADWDYVENQQAFKERVAQRVAKHLARARKWEEEMASVGDDDKARVFDDMVRRERLRPVWKSNSELGYSGRQRRVMAWRPNFDFHTGCGGCGTASRRRRRSAWTRRWRRPRP